MLAMSTHEASPQLTDFMRLIAMQSTTAQHAQQFDGNRTEKFVQFMAHWITNSNKLPAAAAVDKLGDNTLVMTITMDTPAPTGAPPTPRGAIPLPAGPSA
jgi:hypothetical protein